MKTSMQNLIEFIEHQIKETTSLNIKRALMGTVTVIDATCIEPEKEIIKNSFEAGQHSMFMEIAEKKQKYVNSEEYYNNTFKP